MERLVVDASVVVKLFAEEQGSAEAHELLLSSKLPDVEMVAPHFLCLEVLNALTNSYDFSETQLAIFIMDLSVIGIRFVRESPSLLREALEFSQTAKITIYDSTYLALASFYDCVLCTSDKKHHKKEYYDKIVYI
jgi:predicted nucleic acid-binding protein